MTSSNRVLAKTKTRNKTQLFNDGFIKWLGEQPPNKIYDYVGADGDCPIKQYLKSIGINVTIVCPSVYETKERIEVLPSGWNYVVWERPWNFGQAFERAKRRLSE